MEKNSTINTYIKSFYEDITLKELTIIANSNEAEMKEQQQLSCVMKELRQITLSPSKKSLQSILTYSRNSSSKLDVIY